MRKSRDSDSQILAMLKQLKELADESRRLKKMDVEELFKVELRPGSY